MKPPLFLAALAAILGSALLRAAAPATEGPTVQLPDMQVDALYGLEDFKFPAKADLAMADLASGSAPPNITFPGQAFTDGVAAGRATVGVMLDARGHPTDFLLVRYTQRYFGEAVMREARRLQYAAKRLKAVPVPGSFHFTYEFIAPAGLSAMSSFDAMNRRLERVAGGPKFIHEPHREKELDGGQLEPTAVIVPVLPRDFAAPTDRPVRVLATFYVDEAGHVRLPNIESAIAPALAPLAIEALQRWTFKPPTIKGHGVLVHTMRAVAFRPAAAPR